MYRRILYIFALTLIVAGSDRFCMAAEEAEGVTTITINNPETRQIDRMASFNEITLTKEDKNRGYHEEISSQGLVLSSNSNWKLQARVTNPDIEKGLQLKYENGGYAAMNTDYVDLSGATGYAGKETTGSLSLKIVTDWTSPQYSGKTTDLYIKITRNP